MEVNETPREIFAALPKAVGVAVRASREEKGWSQAFLADLMTKLGESWHQTTVAKTERGERPLKLTEAVVLAWALELPSLGHLFGEQREAVSDAVLGRYVSSVHEDARASFEDGRRRLEQIDPKAAEKFMEHMAGEHMAGVKAELGQQERPESNERLLDELLAVAKRLGVPIPEADQLGIPLEGADQPKEETDD